MVCELILGRLSSCPEDLDVRRGFLLPFSDPAVLSAMGPQRTGEAFFSQAAPDPLFLHRAPPLNLKWSLPRGILHQRAVATPEIPW